MYHLVIIIYTRINKTKTGIHCLIYDEYVLNWFRSRFVFVCFEMQIQVISGVFFVPLNRTFEKHCCLFFFMYNTKEIGKKPYLTVKEGKHKNKIRKIHYFY